MRLNEVQFDGAAPITGYGPDFFRVGDQVIKGGALVAPGHQQAWDGLEDVASVLVLADRVDVVLVGMGAEIAHAPPGFRARLEDAGMGVEVMSSASACRTYNVLLGEGRRIAAALLPVGGQF